MLQVKAHAKELNAKYSYLLSAPDADPNGSEAVIRYNRKRAECYVRAEKMASQPAGKRNLSMVAGLNLPRLNSAQWTTPI